MAMIQFKFCQNELFGSIGVLRQL